MTYQEVLDFLFPLHRFGMKPGLERVLELMEVLGSPQERLGQVIHIAGTNGKGTVAAATASIFQTAGRKTALYTSPHFVDFTERIRIDGQQIPREKVAYYCSKLRDSVIEKHATFFEATTAIAFAWFADEGVECSVIETGMGGRLDATNIVQSDYAVITSIGLDHTTWLGSTIADIAAEKAAIIKKGCRVFTAVENPDAFQPIARQAAMCDAPIFIAGRDVACSVVKAEEMMLEIGIRTARHDYNALKAPLTGSFHAANLTLAVMLAEDVGIAPGDIQIGIEQLNQTGYRGRLERIGKSPTLFLDVSHNPDGMRETVNALMPFRNTYMDVYIMLGLASDKDALSIVRELCRLGGSFVTVGIPSERSISPDDLGAICRNEKVPVVVFDSGKEGLHYLREKAKPEDMVLVTGSFYLAGDIISQYDKAIC
ncbi:MAG: bifunctional folylpolyglutamate synthase/dihydrofolate synthase [Chlorobium sp.]|nr:MAG: bifunctional folylpolyglutamate synthase/dihydrofolate synthase [Chlorobium sp.]